MNFSEQTPVEAWKAASEFLCGHSGEANFLLVKIKNPACLNRSWLSKYNPNSYGGTDHLRKVINTIFPYQLWRLSEDRESFYKKYLKVYNESIDKGWGTYFQRMIDFGDGDCSINQIENVICKICSWERRSKTSLKIHLSSPVLDHLTPRGGPCLQYLQFYVGEHLDMVAIYRNHDFTNKVLGNYIGLGQLLQFIADQTNKPVGQLACFSIHAYVSRINITRRMICKD